MAMLRGHMNIRSSDERIIPQLTNIDFYHASQIVKATYILLFLSVLIKLQRPKTQTFSSPMR